MKRGKRTTTTKRQIRERGSSPTHPNPSIYPSIYLSIKHKV